MMKVFTLLVLSLLGLISTAGGADYYVAANGNDEGAGSKDAPFASIGRAAAVAGPGDTVHIGPGLYREQVSFPRS
ncbi:MAG: DUF1565 domain-containing protein, partial [Lentisphaerae bacterium]|nr:DUF1565 domain-containing protein [Lentisphaerota bacterium]